MAEIEGTEFSLFWDIDRPKLGKLGFSGRAAWLRQRVNKTLLEPLAALEKTEPEMFYWLATTELICAGIEALGGFYGNGRYGVAARQNTPFCRFVHAFMHRDFELMAPGKDGNSESYCEHLQKYFRNGLDHGFSISWGGLWPADQAGMREGYLRPSPTGEGVGICPRMLLNDFVQAVDKYFSRLEAEGRDSVIGENFNNRFDTVLGQEPRRVNTRRRKKQSRG